MALVLVAVLSLVSMRQVTRVEPGAVSVRFGFIYVDLDPDSEIRLAEAVKYRPIREYGGLGHSRCSAGGARSAREATSACS